MWPGCSLQLVRSRSPDPWFNLAVEEWLLRHAAADSLTVFLYRNAPCVVLGRNQNPWLECNGAEMRRRGVALARRISGGGAVYHDPGNANCAVIVPRSHYSREACLAPVTAALAALGLQPEVDSRHAIRVAGRKVSGSAFMLTAATALHHGTMLVDADLDALAAVLQPPPADVHTHAIRSVPAAVGNLAALKPGLPPDAYEAALVDALRAVWGGADGPAGVTAADMGRRPGFAEIAARHGSPAWILGRTPAFAQRVRMMDDGREVAVVLHVREGVVESAVDVLTGDEAAGRRRWPGLVGKPYNDVGEAGPFPQPQSHPPSA